MRLDFSSSCTLKLHKTRICGGLLTTEPFDLHMLWFKIPNLSKLFSLEVLFLFLIQHQQVELESVKMGYTNAQIECNAADERAKLLASEVIGLEEKVVFWPW